MDSLFIGQTNSPSKGVWMGRKGVVTTGDTIRIVASFLFVNIMFILFIPLEPIYLITIDLVLVLFLALFIVIRSSDDEA